MICFIIFSLSCPSPPEINSGIWPFKTVWKNKIATAPLVNISRFGNVQIVPQLLSFNIPTCHTHFAISVSEPFMVQVPQSSLDYCLSTHLSTASSSLSTFQSVWRDFLKVRSDYAANFPEKLGVYSMLLVPLAGCVRSAFYWLFSLITFYYPMSTLWCVSRVCLSFLNTLFLMILALWLFLSLPRIS